MFNLRQPSMNRIGIKPMICMACLALITSIHFSCNKVADSIIQKATSLSATSIHFGDAFGMLDAIRTVSYVTVAGVLVPAESNTAIAAFYDTAGVSLYLDAGTVILNGQSLTKDTNNFYTYQNSQVPLDFSSIQWQVSGNGRVPAISKNDSNPVPSYSGYGSLPASITKANGVSINVSGQITGADSVYVAISDYNNKWIIKKVSSSASNAVFSADDLTGLTTGKGMIQVSAFNFIYENHSSKKFYFVNQAIYTKLEVPIN